MATPSKTPARSPRSTITIERMPATYGTTLLGAHATQVLATVDGVLAVRIEDNDGAARPASIGLSGQRACAASDELVRTRHPSMAQSEAE